MITISYSGYRFPPEIVQHAIWLYIRFTLSFRDVEDLLAERGIMVSYETVRRWVNHFGAGGRKRRPKPHTTWHLDEVYLKIDGRIVYLWRAADAEGEVLDVLVQTRRNKRAAFKLMRKLLTRRSTMPGRLSPSQVLSTGRSISRVRPMTTSLCWTNRLARSALKAALTEPSVAVETKVRPAPVREPGSKASPSGSGRGASPRNPLSLASSACSPAMIRLIDAGIFSIDGSCGLA
jgi:putative transposase